MHVVIIADIQTPTALYMDSFVVYAVHEIPCRLQIKKLRTVNALGQVNYVAN